MSICKFTYQEPIQLFGYFEKQKLQIIKMLTLLDTQIHWNNYITVKK